MATPDTIGNVLWWLRSTEEVQHSLGRVTQWGDKKTTNSSRDLFATGTFQPFLQSGSLNGLPVIEFQDTHCLSGTFITGSAPLTVATVCKWARLTQPPSNYDYLLNWGDDTTNDNLSISRWQGSNDITKSAYFNDDGAGNYTGYSPLSGSVWMKMVVLHNTSTVKHRLFVNNTESQVREMTTATSPQAPMILGMNYHGAQFFSGSIAEVIIFSKVLNTQERNDLESYFATRYGF